MLAGGAILAVTWFVTFMRPIMDGDLWFQMAYARQMLENRTLILDHTAFSWSPTDGSLIYCAWLMQFLLYGLYSLGGLPLFFVFRYVVFGVFLHSGHVPYRVLLCRLLRERLLGCGVAAQQQCCNQCCEISRGPLHKRDSFPLIGGRADSFF